ncbi:AFG1-like ATPase domain containing protein [Hyaloscypha variabilis]
MQPPSSTGLTITNPLVLYRSLLSTKVIGPDPAQHRLALGLQKLYYRLKDYSPRTEYGAQLEALGRAVESAPKFEDAGQVAVPGHPLRRNPLFSHLFAKREARDTLALTRVLTSHEAAIKLDSPKGLLLHGEVGTGKSMLVDLLADSLPNRKKRRWHFNTFMLETLARLEQLRQSRSKPGTFERNSEHSMIWLAKDMIETSPILFLDEFQLPDRAASKILSNLFTAFFQLGGVLVATSNRMPDELAKASGMDFAAPPRGGLVRSLLGFGARRSMFPANNEYAEFVDVLKARCEIWNMEGGRDWRRREAEEMNEATEITEAMIQEMIGGFSSLRETGGSEIDLDSDITRSDDIKLVSSHHIAGQHMATFPEETKIGTGVIPKKYFLASSDSEELWQTAIRAALPGGISEQVRWKSTMLRVYGRTIPVERHLEGVTFWTFQELCGRNFGSADYITLASTFHTLILDEVPVLTLLRKNEARRLITLLDALYEARCKLVIRADAGPDELFFPETNKAATTRDMSSGAKNDGGDAVYPETLSEIYQDQTSPFRPNVSTYADDPRTGCDPDEDSDFGPLPGKGNEGGRQLDFGMTSSFTGEDERFAYKRARSRIWQMCGGRWHARSDAGWWRPLPLDVRRWERITPSVPTIVRQSSPAIGDVKLGKHIELERPAGLQGKEIEEREKG